MVEAISSLKKSSDVKVKMSQNSSKTIKFLCSYGGKILPRNPDGKLRYIGGVIRVLAVDRSVSFSELLVKLGELCGSSVILRCQLPTEDLDALISIISDEDLANILEEYDRASQAAESPLKIRAFLSPPKSLKKISPPPSIYNSSSIYGDSSPKYSSQAGFGRPILPAGMARNHHHHHHHHHHHQFYHKNATTVVYPVGFEKSRTGSPMLQQYAYISQGSPARPMYLVHNGNHWQ